MSHSRLATRLCAVEHARDLAQQREWRANRMRIASDFRAFGDPRDHQEDFAALTPARQRHVAWQYEVWKDSPAGYIAGVAHPRFYPEPPNGLEGA